MRLPTGKLALTVPARLAVGAAQEQGDGRLQGRFRRQLLPRLRRDSGAALGEESRRRELLGPPGPSGAVPEAQDPDRCLADPDPGALCSRCADFPVSRVLLCLGALMRVFCVLCFFACLSVWGRFPVRGLWVRSYGKAGGARWLLTAATSPALLLASVDCSIVPDFSLPLPLSVHGQPKHG